MTHRIRIVIVAAAAGLVAVAAFVVFSGDRELARGEAAPPTKVKPRGDWPMFKKGVSPG